MRPRSIRRRWHGDGPPPVGNRVAMSRSSLQRKLWRELRESVGGSAAIVAVIAAGVSVFVMALSTLSFLEETRDAYYDRYRFADLFAGVNRAPQPLADRLAEIPGVARVQTRIAAEVTLRVPGLDEPAMGRLVSLPPTGVAELNAVHLLRGRLPDPEAADEVLAGEAFAQANRLRLGDSVEAILNGRLQQLRIVGMALSPEHIYQVRPGDLLPDDRRYGVFWASRRQLEAAFDMRGSFNDVTVRLSRGATEPPVIAAIDRLLEPYGGIGAYGRDEQLSARFLDDEIKQLRATGLITPLIFLGVAAFLLNMVLARRIELQRESIATLRAFGYHGREIAWHYLQFALVISVAGAMLGGFAGTMLASGLCELYAQFFRFPTFVFCPSPKILWVGGSVSIVSGLFAAWLTVRRVLRMPPAEAMRPAAPARYRRGWLEAFGLARRLSPAAVMVIRRLRRRPVAAALSTLGIAFSVAVLLVSNFAVEAVRFMIDFQMAQVQRHDIRVAFRHAASAAGEHELRSIAGVTRVEAFRSVPVNLRHGNRQRRLSILGLEGLELYRLLDSGGDEIRLPPEGLVVNDALAEWLGVRTGDRVRVEVLEERRQHRSVEVVGTVKEFAGLHAYMNRDALHDLLQEDRRVSGAFLAIDPIAQVAVGETLREMPMTAAISIKSAGLQAIRETIEENQAMMQRFNVFFATVIALGVVYNLARITMSEQRRELATLRVIGFSRWEISAMFLGELLLLTAVAIPLGWLIGTGLCYATVKGFESELYRIPLVISRHSMLRAAGVTFAAALLSGLIVRRSLDKLDLVEVLKSQE